MLGIVNAAAFSDTLLHRAGPTGSVCASPSQEEQHPCDASLSCPCFCVPPLPPTRVVTAPVPRPATLRANAIKMNLSPTQISDEGKLPRLDLLNLTTEISGEQRDNKDAKVATVESLRVSAVNNDGRFGRWVHPDQRPAPL